MGWLSDKLEVVRSVTGSAARAVGDAVTDFARDPAGNIRSAATAVRNFGEYVAENPQRAAALVGQGVVKGINSGVGTLVMVGDLAHNYIVRPVAKHGLGAEWEASNWGEQTTEFLNRQTHAAYDALGIERVRAENGYERVLFYGGQAVGEIGGFIAASALTAGAAGAGLAAVRGGAIAARGVSAAAGTARFLAPVTPRMAMLEAGIVGTSVSMNMAQYRREEEIARQAASQLLSSDFEGAAGNSAAGSADITAPGITITDPYIDMAERAASSDRESNAAGRDSTVVSAYSRTGSGRGLTDNFHTQSTGETAATAAATPEAAATELNNTVMAQFISWMAALAAVFGNREAAERLTIQSMQLAGAAGQQAPQTQQSAILVPNELRV